MSPSTFVKAQMYPHTVEGDALTSRSTGYLSRSGPDLISTGSKPTIMQDITTSSQVRTGSFRTLFSSAAHEDVRPPSMQALTAHMDPSDGVRQGSATPLEYIEIPRSPALHKPRQCLHRWREDLVGRAEIQQAKACTPTGTGLSNLRG
jgi:hypothetical protein